jgi:hypothetical protein
MLTDTALLGEKEGIGDITYERRGAGANSW